MNTNNTVRPVDSLNIVTVVTDETQVNVTRPVTNVVRVVGPGPIGPQGIQGIQGEIGLTITDLFVARGNDTWSTTGSLQISGSLIVSQSVTGLSGFTGSLLGTAATASYFAGYGNSAVLINQHETYNTFTGSIQTQADGLSNATSSYVLNSVTSSMLQPYVLTSVTQSMLRPYVLTSVTSSMLQPYVLTSVTQSMLQPYVLTSVTQSMLQPYVLTSVTQSMLQPYVLTSITGSMLQPYVLTSATSSMIVSGALTASFVNTLKQDVTISGSVFISGSIIHNGNYVQTGINILSGSNIVTGSSTLIGQSQITGSVNVSGSVRITGSLTADFVYLTGSLRGTAATASFVTSSNVQGPHGMNSIVSASYALTSSYINTLTQDVTISGSLFISGSTTQTGNVNVTGNYTQTGNTILSGSSIVTGSNILIGQSQITGSVNVSGSVVITGSLTANFVYLTGSLLGTAATASFVTASNVQGPHGMNSVISASYAVTASYVNVLTQDVTISGSLFTTGSNTLIGNTYLTGSLNVSGSTVQTGNNTLIGNTVLSGSIAISGSSTITGVTVMSGSINISGSTTQIGNNSLLGNTFLSGSIIISGAFGTNTPTVKIYGDTTHDGYLRFNPVSTNIDTSISASYIYVSGSTQDLYFSQNGKGYSNVTRLRWLEGNLYTGLLHGGLLSQVNSNTYQVSSGSGIIVNLNASFNDDPYPVVQFLEWPNLTKTIDALSASFDQQFASIDSTNNIFAQGTPYTNGQYNTLIPIGIILHQNNTSINGVQTFPSVAYGWKQRSYDFIKAFGPLKIAGYTLTQSGSSVGGLVLGGGTAWVDGRNYTIDPNNAAYIVEGTGITTSKIFRYYQSGSNWQNDWGYNTNGGAGFTAIDPSQYSNAGTLTALTNNNKWSIQRVFYFPNSATKALFVYYGNAQYDTKTDAIAAIATEPFNEAPNTTANAIFIGYMILQKIADFNAPTTYEFKAAGLFRAGGAGGAGGGGVTALSNLTDVSISTSVYGDLLMKSAGAWVNSKQLSGSYGIIGNLNVTGSTTVTGSSIISGSLTVTGSLYADFAYLTGSLLGTAATASFVTSSNVLGPHSFNSVVSASHAVSVRSYAQLIGDGATNNITVTHGLGTNDLHITVYSASGNFENIIPDIHRTSTNAIEVRFVNPPGLNQYRVYISV
jgi:hypothetical protein